MDVSGARSLIEEALAGDRGRDQQFIAQVSLNIVETLLRKNMDYGSSIFNPGPLTPDLSASALIRCRMNDKISRIRHLLTTDGGPQVNESIEDTYRDLAGYTILELVRRTKEAWQTQHHTPTPSSTHNSAPKPPNS